jgi:hypothetical protein
VGLALHPSDVPLISKGAPRVLSMGVLAYSLGPDGIEERTPTGAIHVK